MCYFSYLVDIFLLNRSIMRIRIPRDLVSFSCDLMESAVGRHNILIQFIHSSMSDISQSSTFGSDVTTQMDDTYMFLMHSSHQTHKKRSDWCLHVSNKCEY